MSKALMMQHELHAKNLEQKNINKPVLVLAGTTKKKSTVVPVFHLDSTDV